MIIYYLFKSAKFTKKLVLFKELFLYILPISYNDLVNNNTAECKSLCHIPNSSDRCPVYHTI